MVGIVIVSHSEKLAHGVTDLCRMMAPACPMATAGGDDDGGYGTSCRKIKAAINSVDGKDGVLVLTDMGSAVMTTEMVLEELGRSDVLMADCPIAEGAVAASISSSLGDGLEQVMLQACAAKNLSKVQ